MGQAMNSMPGILPTHRLIGVVEVVGPSGTGKTTLSRALAQAAPHGQCGLPLRSGHALPFSLVKMLTSLPSVLGNAPHGSHFSRGTLMRMLYLQAQLATVQHFTARRHALLVLDQGPIYKLAELGNFSPADNAAPRLQHWRSRMVAQWARVLDLIVQLDAADEVLIARIEARAKAHVVKTTPQVEAAHYLARYRAAIGVVLSQWRDSGGPRVLRFKTDQTGVEPIVRVVLAALALETQPGTLGHSGSIER